MGILPLCLSVYHMCAEVLGPLKLELQMVFSQHVGNKN